MPRTDLAFDELSGGLLAAGLHVGRMPLLKRALGAAGAHELVRTVSMRVVNSRSGKRNATWRRWRCRGAAQIGLDCDVNWGSGYPGYRYRSTEWLGAQ
jgi:hypothetical protein